MKSVFVIIAEGPNEVDKICRLFKTYDDAVEFCDTLGIEKAREGRYSLPERGSDLIDGKWVLKPVFEKLFTRYYDGCGEAYALSIQEVAFDTTFTGWDLD